MIKRGKAISYSRLSCLREEWIDERSKETGEAFLLSGYLLFSSLFLSPHSLLLVNPPYSLTHEPTGNRDRGLTGREEETRWRKWQREIDPSLRSSTQSLYQLSPFISILIPHPQLAINSLHQNGMRNGEGQREGSWPLATSLTVPPLRSVSRS